MTLHLELMGTLSSFAMGNGTYHATGQLLNYHYCMLRVIDCD